MPKHFLIYIIVLSNWILTPFTKAATNVDSLKALLCDEKVIHQFNLRIRIGDYYMVDSPARAALYYSEAQKIARYLKNDTLEARAFDNLGSSKLKTDDYRESANNFQSALAIYEKYQLQDKIAGVNYNLGLVDYYRGNYEQAINNYRKALKIFKLRKDRRQEANTYQNIGLIHHDLENDEEALEYYQQALEINEELGTKSNIAGLTQNIGLLNMKSENLDLAAGYIKKSLKIYQELKEDDGVGISLSNMGLIYQKQGRFQEALDNYLRSLEVFTRINYPYGRIYALHNVGTSYADMKNPDKAFDYYNKSMALSREKGHVQGVVANYEAMSNLYADIGDYENSLDYYKRYDDLEDSIHSVETRNQIAEMETSYKLELMDQELSRKNKELLQQKRAKRILFTGSLTLLLLLVFLIAAYIQKNKAEKELSEHKLKLEKLVRQRTRQLDNEISERKIAEESDKLKSAFLANMSHELRTPMNAIIAFTNFIKDQNLSSEKREEYINYITAAGESLLHLIDDIIDIAKIESKELTIHQSRCNITRLLTELQNIFAELKKKKNKDFIRLILDPYCLRNNVLIRTDPFRLKQILSNLLENALKYTNEGSVQFGYKQNKNHFEFYVKDTGIGIPEEKFNFIFERFSQIDQSVEKQFGGTGLGLAITSNLVGLLGGQIWVESKVNEGSTFYFTIPFKEIHIEPLSSDVQAKSSGSVSFFDYKWESKVILVAEDEDLNYKVLESALSRTNARILRASNGLEAVEQMKGNHIDLVLMDIQMPVMDGYKAAKAIKKINHNIPVIAQTSFAMEGEKEKCLIAGCDDYLAKPLDLNELFAKMNKYMV
ncbi:MAG: tetratricopeptide repeat protein [Bacteroidales bacterium]|nr:tetratricopeptide repeat protein [Bacteroidales bacterium]